MTRLRTIFITIYLLRWALAAACGVSVMGLAHMSRQVVMTAHPEHHVTRHAFPETSPQILQLAARDALNILPELQEERIRIVGSDLNSRLAITPSPGRSPPAVPFPS